MSNNWNNGYGVITVKKTNEGARLYVYGADNLNSTNNQFLSCSLTVNGSVYESSDDRLKENEVFIKNATETLMKLKPQNRLLFGLLNLPIFCAHTTSLQG